VPLLCRASIWLVLSYISAAGLVGGLLNALMADEGFIVPRLEMLDSRRIWRPGFLGNMFVGAV